jgi:hypothetical protein
VNRKLPRACLTFALALVLSGAACGRKIGDNCQTAADCNPNGGRICDLSQPGGYCTILGCNETSCPSEATCIRYFPVEYLSKPCNPFCEDRACGGPDAGPDAGCPQICDQASPSSCPSGPTNDCTADEICLDQGVCAPLSSEMRFCAFVCSSNSDCRGGYICRPTGTAGAVALSATPCTQTSFCSPAQ